MKRKEPALLMLGGLWIFSLEHFGQMQIGARFLNLEGRTEDKASAPNLVKSKMHAMWAFQIAKAVRRVPDIAVHAPQELTALCPQLCGSTVRQSACLRLSGQAPPRLSAFALPQTSAIKHGVESEQPARPPCGTPLMTVKQPASGGGFGASKPVFGGFTKDQHQLSSNAKLLVTFGYLQSYPAPTNTTKPLSQIGNFFAPNALETRIKPEGSQSAVHNPLLYVAPGFQQIRPYSEQPPPFLEHHAARPISPVTSVGVNPQLDPTLAQAVCGATEQAKSGGEKKQTSFLGWLRASLTRNQLLGLGHLASLFGVIALFMKDMLFLRSFMVCGGICGITFNMLQPTPMYIPSMWGCVFLLINLTQIGILLLERREVEFSSDELDVFELEFQRHGVTACQFKKLMRYAEAEWRELPTDHVILKQGDQVDDIYLIISGCAEVTVNGGAVGQVQRGSLVGETALLAKGHLAGATVTTLVPTKVVVWDKHKLRQVLANDPSLILSVSATINSDLATKLAKRNLSKDRSLETYKDVLGGICSAGRVSPEEKKALREFRQRHGIRPSEHEAAVREIGWTLDEYDDGAKHHSGRLAGLLSRVPRWTGRRKALQTMEQSPHPADVPVLKQETQPQLEPQTPHFNREKLPPGKGLKGEAASLQNLSPLAVCLDDKVKAKMTDRKKDVEAVLGARETQLLYATLEVPEDERGAIDLNFS